MRSQTPPYELIARITVGLICVGYLTHRIAPAFYPGALATVMAICVILIIACVGLELYVRIGQAKAGNLFLIRNATFYTGILILVLVISNLYQLVDIHFLADEPPTYGELIARLFYVGFGLGFTTLTFSFIYFDSVMIEHRNGALHTTLPVFSVTNVAVEEEELLISSQEARDVLLRRPQFPSAAWSELRTRVSALKN
ncbi:hypothetical protein [Lewinella sp. 4G2]|uniref:hypothetical protein n=1 Tax=Lewinella sp. 4G2 TaxID=1803372 RepID=UPI0007B47D2D|nr:hypothetical protein [Lewinella sp. 4G2]OAV43710.1 hypothetical protein A3850_003990 [Lewinella sp. 4G2]